MNKKIFNLIFSIFFVVIPITIYFFVENGVVLSDSLTVTVLTSLIQANATFIGFFGIIMIFNWTKSSDFSNMLMNNALQTLEQIKELERKIANNKIQDKEILIEKKERLKELTNAIKKETKERVDFGNFGTLPVGCFFLSIFFSIIGLTQISNNPIISLLLVFTLTLMSWGIFFTILSMAGSFAENKKNKIE